MRSLLNGKSLLAIVVLALLAGNGASARASLIAYFPLDGNLNNEVNVLTNGTAFGGTPTYVTGFTGQGLQTGGAGEATFRVPIDISPSSMPSVTIGGWFLSTSNVTNQTLFANDAGGYGRGVNIDSRVPSPPEYGAFNGGGLTPGSAPTGHWDFVAVTYSPGNVTLDVNGTFYSSGQSSPDGDPFLSVGQSAHYDLPFSGTIDNVFIYNTALSQSALNSIQANGLPEPGTNLMMAFGAIGLLAAVRRRLKKGPDARYLTAQRGFADVDSNLLRNAVATKN